MTDTAPPAPTVDPVLDPKGDTTVVQTAPATATTVTRIGDWKDNAPIFLMVMVTTGFFGLVALLSFHQIPAENVNVVNLLTGSIGTAWISAMSYFFGSTAASKSKDNTIATMATAPKPPA